jgi:glycosyltransferase involved in cell wall biosynthesis
MILDQPFPPDARVEREAMALVQAGYEVHLLCLKRDEDIEREFLHHGIWVHRVDPEQVDFYLPVVGTATRLPYKGLVKNIFHNIWNIDTVWHTLIRRFVTRFQIDILHVHDLRLLSTGLAAVRNYHVPVVSDLHENYPALMQMLKGRTNPARGEKQRVKWDALQQTGCAQAAGVITVSEEMKEILGRQGIPPQKVTVLPNTVDLDKFLATEANPETLRRYKAKFMLTYVGHINNIHRGIHTVIEALGFLKDEIPEILFVAAGPTRDHYLADLQRLMTIHQVEHLVEFTGWQEEEQFRSYIEASDVCLCPHIANDQTNTGIPNKVYLYHLFNKPIVASDFLPMRRYIEATGGGLLYPSGNARALADQILALYRDIQLRHQLAENGRQAVLTTYNWSRTREDLLALYQRVGQQIRVRRGDWQKPERAPAALSTGR